MPRSLNAQLYSLNQIGNNCLRWNYVCEGYKVVSLSQTQPHNKPVPVTMQFEEGYDGIGSPIPGLVHLHSPQIYADIGSQAST